MPPAPKTPSSFEAIYNALRKRILSEVYIPGQKLTENALAEEFSCSRTPIREALMRLENEGLIVVRPKSGTYVRMLTGKNYQDLLEVRSYLEALAFRLCVEHRPPGMVEELKDLLARMDTLLEGQPIDMPAYAELHYQFHYRQVVLSGNEMLVQMFEKLNLKSSHMFLHIMNRESALATQAEHHRIVQYLAEGDAKGEKFIVSHLWKKRDYLGY